MLHEHGQDGRPTLIDVCRVLEKRFRVPEVLDGFSQPPRASWAHQRPVDPAKGEGFA